MDPALYNLGPKRGQLAKQQDFQVDSQIVSKGAEPPLLIDRVVEPLKETEVTSVNKTTTKQFEKIKILKTPGNSQASEQRQKLQKKQIKKSLKSYKKGTDNPFLDMFDAIGTFFVVVFGIMLAATAITLLVYLASLGLWWLIGGIAFFIIDIFLTKGEMTLLLLMIFMEILLNT